VEHIKGKALYDFINNLHNSHILSILENGRNEVHYMPVLWLLRAVILINIKAAIGIQRDMARAIFYSLTLALLNQYRITKKYTYHRGHRVMGEYRENTEEYSVIALFPIGCFSLIPCLPAATGRQAVLFQYKS